MNTPIVIAILFFMVLLVTAVYGPIAALLVELFPTNIRYTSMSLPYHIGNGWFGGFLPTTAFAMVAATGAGAAVPARDVQARHQRVTEAAARKSMLRRIKTTIRPLVAAMADGSSPILCQRRIRAG